MRKKAEDYKYPSLVIEMARNGDTLETLGNLLEITRQTVRTKIEGKTDWTISEVEKLCNYYKKDYYELFKGE